MRLKKKPVKPTHGKIHVRIRPYDTSVILSEVRATVIEHLTRDHGYTYAELVDMNDEDIEIGVVGSWCEYDGDELEITVHMLGPIAHFNERLENYHDSMVKYNLWYKLHSVAIEAEIERRATVKAEKALANRELKKATTLAEIVRLEAKLEKLKR